MKNILKPLFAGALLLSGAFISAQNTTTIPIDSRVKHGKLSNGMSYYVMHNEEPKERASLYFVQNVGAILEEDSQNGLAHFLEHMAFNGLEHYPGKNMLNYLESKGIVFGADINAYTAQDETVYNLSNIPATDENLLDSALLVLHDWSGGLLLEGEEIEAERGVIHEEWRTRRNSRFRLMKQTYPYMFNNSQYAIRDVIGSIDVIDNFKHQELKDYYAKWYRPDLQAVVVVGDIDADKIEQKIKDLFSKIPAKKNAAERKYYPVEDSKEMGFVVARDKEAQGVSINWIFRKDPTTVKDEAYLKNDLAQGMMSSMLNNRLSELTRKPDCPALQMQVGGYNMARTKDAAYLAVVPKENKEKEAFSLMLTELERARRYGFTESELERVKTNYIRQYEAYEKEYEKVDNETWAKQLGNLFLEASPFPSLDWEMNFAKTTIAALTLKDVYAPLNDFQNTNNSVITVQGPDKESVIYPTEEELMAEVKKVMATEITAYEDEALDAPLVTDELVAKNFVSETVIKGVENAKLYKLENGARVVIMPTELSKDEILMSAYSFGGTSVLDNNQLESAELATTIAGMSGVGEFNATQLKKKLTGKMASVNPSIGTNTEGFGGSSTVEDFETMLQLLYQKFEHPRFEKETFDMIMGSMKNQLAYINADNGRAFKDTIGVVSSNYSERNIIFGEEFVKNIDFEKAKAIYADRIQDASDFTFIFVGNIDESKHIPMIKKYIGCLSSTNRSENWVNHNIKPAEGTTTRTIERPMEVAKATVYYAIYNDVKYNLETRMYVRTISELLSKRYMETIREEEGGSYGVGVRPSISKRSYEHAVITMSFDCDPEKQEKLTGILKSEIENLVNNGVNTDDLNEIKKSYIKSRQESEDKNNFWLSVIQGSLMNEEPIATTDEYNKIIEGLSEKSVQKFAKKLFKGYDSVEVVMVPKK
ncbi:M16 family metallopeptidase [Plebeiibacterium marinum]|uniref:Insulinase family protein n=1 Tax=Plebeiibacterium marinum TaxID=2992111 RepID=A0AAE3MH52_9BACT|nr:M16 family metallopeptidase [Plebeiobacterium marinum]MCW3807567.1 insulinase family protein [Plebeiobacterium marinum]